jgi:hypothetical protein
LIKLYKYPGPLVINGHQSVNFFDAARFLELFKKGNYKEFRTFKKILIREEIAKL